MEENREQQLRRRSADIPSRRLRKGMYVLPSLFTTANVALGFFAIFQAILATQDEYWHLDHAAKAIGIAIVADFMDGMIARLTHTASDFGRELDSLADVITFGVAPAVLAWVWGFHWLGLAGMVDWLALTCPQTVRFATNGERPVAGTVYFPPEDCHLLVTRQGTLALIEEPERRKDGLRDTGGGRFGGGGAVGCAWTRTLNAHFRQSTMY